MKQLSAPVVVDQKNAMVRGSRDWRATVGWSIPADVLEFPVFPMVVHADRTGTELHSNLNVTEMRTVLLAPSDISSLPCSQQLTQSAASTHQSSATEHTVRATAERCIVVMYPLGGELASGTAKQTSSTQILLWEPWAFGCLEGRRREGAIMVRQRCQWSAEKAGASHLRLHDATNGDSPLCHGSAKEAAHWLVLKETDRQFLDPRISHAVVNIADEETEIDLPTGSGIWPGGCCAPRIFVKATCIAFRDFCAPRIFVKATCNAFTPALKRLEELGRCSAHRVEQRPVTRKTQHQARRDTRTTSHVTSWERAQGKPDGGAHSTVRPGRIDDSTGRSRSADDSLLGLKQPMKKVLVSREEAVTSRTAPVARGSTRDSTARPRNWGYADSTILLGRAHNESHSTNSPPSERQRRTSCGRWRQRRKRSRGASFAWMRQGTQQETVHRLTTACLRPCRVLLTHLCESACSVHLGFFCIPLPCYHTSGQISSGLDVV